MHCMLSRSVSESRSAGQQRRSPPRCYCAPVFAMAAVIGNYPTVEHFCRENHNGIRTAFIKNERKSGQCRVLHGYAFQQRTRENRMSSLQCRPWLEPGEYLGQVTQDIPANRMFTVACQIALSFSCQLGVHRTCPCCRIGDSSLNRHIRNFHPQGVPLSTCPPGGATTPAPAE
jgi:hypothetical protein